VEFRDGRIFISANVVNFIICQQKQFFTYRIGTKLPTKRFFSQDVHLQLQQEDQNLCEMLRKEGVDVIKSSVLAMDGAEMCSETLEQHDL